MDTPKNGCSEKEQELARKQMNYWKKTRSNDEVYASELGFSLIYDNIRPEAQNRALATMGMETLPNLILLVQVDNYLSKYSDLDITMEFSVKALVWKSLQVGIKNSNYQGFAANLVGLDTLICFLCMEEQNETQIKEFAAYLAYCVHRDTEVSVTICISEPIRRLADFPKVYTKARESLYHSFYMNKGETVISNWKNRDNRKSEQMPELVGYYPMIYACLSGADQERFSSVLTEMCDVMRNERIPPKAIKTTFSGLAHIMEAYAQNCSLENRENVAPTTAHCANLILGCGYQEDMIGHLLDYFTFLASELSKLPNRDQAQVFREPIVEYVQNHFGEAITLRQVADIMGYSPYYLTRLFKKYFGCTLTEYLADVRVQRSKQLLVKENIAIGEVAVLCGFESANYFSSCFRSHVGTTPSQYRKENRA